MTSIEILLSRVESILNPQGITSQLLPILPKNIMEWITQARPYLGRRKRNFDLFPYWIDIYEDNHPNIMAKAARQTFKTTTCTDIIANGGTTHEGVEVTYVADNDAHRSAFSRQRLRRETFQANPLLKQFLPYGRAAVTEINLLNDSVIYLLTDEGEYRSVEGKSNHLLVCDEFQYHDVQFLYKALYTLSQTHGRFYGFGIGGEQGSEYVDLWERTDQREWVYDDPDWRTRLQFDVQGRIINTSTGLKAILSGRWVAQKPENTQFRGYHIPQTIVPTIPLTIESAINDYHIQPQLSIEYQRKYFPRSIFLSHTMAEDYKAERRPITPEMIRSCMDNQISMLSPDEVLELKEIYQNKIRVIGGIDFGSSIATPTTVLSVNIHYRGDSHRYQIAHIEKIPQGNHPMDKARHIVEVFRAYGCDFSIGDWGHGQDMIPFIQDGGRDSHDVSFEGLGKSHFMGCRTIGDPTKPFSEYTEDTTDDGNLELSTITIDKTTTIQNFIDLFGQYVSHPKYPTDEKLKRPVYIIPGRNDYEIDFILKEWPKLTRTDLAENPEDSDENRKQNVRKEFSHPPDSLMSQIYTFVADNNYQDDAFKIIPVRRKRR